MKKMFVMLAALVLIAGCVGQTAASTPPATTPPSTTPETSNTAAVTIQNFAFAPSELHVAVGTKVTWMNLDSAPHKVASDTDAFQSDSLGNGASYSYMFDKAGTYAYHCAIHTSMTGKIVVG